MKRTRLVRASVVGAAVVVALVVLMEPFFAAIGRAMIVDDRLEPADFVAPTYDDPELISSVVASLVQSGFAKRIALPRLRPGPLQRIGAMPPTHELWQTLLERRGISRDAILFAGDTEGDDTAVPRSLVDLLKETGGQHLIAVALAPRTRLLRSAWQPSFQGSSVRLSIHAARRPEWDERTWWRHDSGRGEYFDAYCVWAARLLR